MAAKNRTFHKRFIITVKGVTTNDFMSGMIENFLSEVVQAWDREFKQIKETKLEVEEVENADPKL